MRGEGFGAMIITHYQRLLNYITPDVVHVMMEGKAVSYTHLMGDVMNVLFEMAPIKPIRQAQ